MRLRSIILLISALTVVSAGVGGYFSYSRVKLSLRINAEQLASHRITDSKGRFTTFIAEQLKPVRTLAGLAEIRQLLERPDGPNLAAANNVLDLFKVTLEADVCYVMDETGLTLASSNRLDQDSFVGSSFSFRPYFQQALRGTSSVYMALGTESGKRGVYYSYPIVDSSNRQPLGVAVIKASVAKIENEFTRAIAEDETLLLTDPHGIIFITSKQEWLFHSLARLTPREEERVARSRQFGDGPWPWLGFTLSPGEHQLIDNQGGKLLFYEEHFEIFPGWRIIYLRRQPSAFAASSLPFLQPAGMLILLFFFLITCSVFVLYRKARFEIIHRHEAEAALKQSEERYRMLYLRTPALLHSIDQEGRLVSVSHYWSEALGYDRDEVIGRKVTDFMTPESRKRAREKVIPDFLRTGFIKDIPYKFEKKDGEVIDILLSAIAEHDREGNIVRSLAILVDITHLKRTEEKLKMATLALSRYSQELEQQVRERTAEITNILKYTPAVVYLKDTSGRYQLINSRFEKLFAVDLEDIRGKTDDLVFDDRTADRISRTDRQVMETGKSLQVEEIIRQADGPHVYLSVKFPLFDDSGRVSGLGGISTDITDLKKAQERLRQLSNKILSGQERERAAIARELHDELGQALTALRMDAVWLERKLGAHQADIVARSRAMSELIDKTIDEVRSMAIRLRPGVLDDLGLLEALEWLVDDFEKRFAVPCTFRHRAVPDLDDTVATVLYRITQEALTNIARHAMASQVDVSLIGREQEVLLSVRDDGRGFDPGSLGNGDSLGLAGIRERAALIDAGVEIETSPAMGSRIRIRIPLTAQGESSAMVGGFAETLEPAREGLTQS